MSRTYKISGNKIYFKFSYDISILSEVKCIDSRSYLPATKEWCVENTINNSKRINNFIKKFNFINNSHEDIKDVSQKDVNVELEDFCSFFDFSKLKSQPRDYQKYAINYMLTKKCVINGDDVGCGKTYESIFSVEIGNLFPCLVVTLDSVKEHWRRSWISTKERKIQVLNSGDKFEHGCDIYIINYQSLAKNSQTFGIEIKYKELENINFKSLIIDESQNCKNSKSLKSKAVKKLSKNISHIFLLTGTAIMNKPCELMFPLQIIRVFNSLFGGWDSFTKKFCDAKQTQFGIDISGCSNPKELNKILRQNCYFRREKKEILNDLPDYQQTLLPIEISNKTLYNKIESNLIKFLKETKGEYSANRAENAEFLVLRNELRQSIALGKIELVKEIVDSILESSKDKIIIFGIHKQPLTQLANYYNCWLIDGSVESKDKQLIIDDFKVSKERVLLGNMNALGTGTDGLQHTSSTMIIFELPDRPSDLTQVLGRLHRSGQKNNVQIIIPIAINTIDELMWESLEAKREVTDAINSGKSIKKIDINSLIINRLENK